MEVFLLSSGNLRGESLGVCERASRSDRPQLHADLIETRGEPPARSHAAHMRNLILVLLAAVAAFLYG